MKPQLRLVRFNADNGEPTVGVAIGESIFALGIPTMGELLATNLTQILRECTRAIEQGRPVAGQVELLPPIDGRTEVWGAGVTYERSGTGIVPELDFGVKVDDVVRISISGLGEMANRVESVGSARR